MSDGWIAFQDFTSSMKQLSMHLVVSQRSWKVSTEKTNAAQFRGKWKKVTYSTQDYGGTLPSLYIYAEQKEDVTSSSFVYLWFSPLAYLSEITRSSYELFM